MRKIGHARSRHRRSRMTFPCHLFVSWHLARLVTQDVVVRRWIGCAGLVADLDGVGVVADIITGQPRYYEAWHHLLGHNLFVGILLFGLAGVWCRSWRVAGWTWVGFHVHLTGDLLSGRGPDGSGWPVVYGWPVSGYEWQWAGQIRLDAWPNTAAFLALLAWAVVAIKRGGRSPLELLSSRLDRQVLGAFRSVLASRKTAPQPRQG
jgi:hypothetical protein